MLFLFVFSALSLSTATFAAITVIPDVAGLGGNGYTPSAGQLAGTQPWASGNYSTSGTVNIGGKPLTIPAKFPLAAGAASIVKNAMRINPYALAGTLAAGWLADQGIAYIDDQWQKKVPVDGDYFGGVTWANGYNTECGVGTYGCTDLQAAIAATKYLYPPPRVFKSCTFIEGSNRDFNCVFTNSTGDNTRLITTRATSNPAPADNYQPFSPGDFDALPDPTPVVAPELPSAPYMSGAPVGKPTYQEGASPHGDPYKAPDGSTVQPMASVTNNNNVTNNYNSSVTVSTYNVTTHNSSGQPIPEAEQTKTPTEEKQDQCEKYPDSLGCLKMGEVSSPDLQTQQKTIAAISPVSVGGVGSCPAPLTTSFMGNTITMRWDLPCQAAGMLKPLILALAWLSAGVIFIGGVRQ